MNYTELQTAVEDAVENSFSAEMFANMTKLAEEKVYNSVQIPALRKNVTGTMTASNKYVAAPTDFLSVFSMAVVNGSGVYSYLLNKDVNFIREAYPTPTSTGLPKYYSIFGPDSNDADELTFIFGPTPDSGYTLELHYFYYPETIVTATTSWLGDNFHSVLFNAVMVEAARQLKLEEDMVALYLDQYKQSLTLLKNLGDGKMRQDAYRSGQLRTQVI
jgi:hypothetical protein